MYICYHVDRTAINVLKLWSFFPYISFLWSPLDVTIEKIFCSLELLNRTLDLIICALHLVNSAHKLLHFKPLGHLPF